MLTFEDEINTIRILYQEKLIDMLVEVRVLFDVVALKSLEFLLGDKGYTFSSAMSAEEALEMLATQSFDVVISDIGLPTIIIN